MNLMQDLYNIEEIRLSSVFKKKSNKITNQKKEQRNKMNTLQMMNLTTEQSKDLWQSLRRMVGIKDPTLNLKSLNHQESTVRLTIAKIQRLREIKKPSNILINYH